ncbi:MAG: penicillin-binding protein 1A [Burkholderiales bacterium]
MLNGLVSARWVRWILYSIGALVGVGLIGLALALYVAQLAYNNLPPVDSLTDYRPKIPLRIYTADGALIGEFGEERRAIVTIAEVPELLKHAIVAAEDERFYEHTGVDYQGVLRAALSNLTSGGRRQGASTITMQLARNLFLTSDRTYIRKLYEVLLARKIEATLTKDQILEIYINQIYLGQRAYGFAAASQTYFSRALSEVSVAEAAMLAGLPKAPSTFNPVVNPKRAKQRQLYVLRRMHELGYITEPQLTQAQNATLGTPRDMSSDIELRAEFVAEMVRQALFERYPEDVYTRGFRVYTTITKADQEAAYQALRRGALEYDRRHGYRGPESFVDLPANASEERLDDALQELADRDDLAAALVLEAGPKQVRAHRRGGETVTIGPEGLRFVQRFLDAQAPAGKRIARGAVIRVVRDAKGNYSIGQVPDVEGALVALNPTDGAIRALVGGFDFNRNKFNHVTQAWRQPGSSFKPFIYSAALEKGFTAATVVADEPILVDAAQTGSQAWEPKNYDGKFEGPMRLRTALAKSKNMVSIRVLQAIGAQYAQDFITRFGFEPDKHPPYLTLALGAGSVTPLQVARGYAVFANGGFRIDPYLISRILDDRGNLIAQAQPTVAGSTAQRVLDQRNAFVMDSMMRDVVRAGTAARAMSLGRSDLAGKTGTTNDYNDAWFAGYQTNLVAVTWLGFDQPRRLGNGETGGQAALPIWMNYMGPALKGTPNAERRQPDGVVGVRIDPETGLTSPDGSISEYFYRENVPRAMEREEPIVRRNNEDEPRREERRTLF